MRSFLFTFIAAIAVGCAGTSEAQPNAAPQSKSKHLSKIKLNLDQLDANGLRGPADGKVAVSFEFAIPNTDKHKQEVKKIDPTIRFMPGSRGRVRAEKDQCLCIGSTHQKNFREVLRKLASRPYIKVIIECHFE